MKIYKWEGKGFYLGSVVIVVAESMDSAKAIIEKALIETGLKSSWVESEEVTEIEADEQKIIYLDNGDY